MKKSIYFIFIALLCAVGCQVQELDGPEEVIVGEEFFYAEIEQNGSTTKTYIDEFNHVNFQKGDQVVAFIGNTEPKKFQVEDSAEGKTSGKFNVVKDSDGKRVGSVDALNAFLAYYPYQKINVDQSHVSEGRYSLRGISFPSEQKYDTKHIVSQNALPMMSISADVSEGTVFKNVCGVIRLNIRGNGNIRQISFRGLNGEKISGTATVSMSMNNNPLVVMDTLSNEEVILDCGETGVALSPDVAKQFMIVLPPMKFEKGFEIKVTDTENGVMVKKVVPVADVSYEVKRSRIMDMKEFTYGQALTPDDVVPANQIWYMTNDNLILEPKDGTAACFGANITSNAYVNGKGVITFDGEVTKIGKKAFAQLPTLSHVMIPEGVASIGNGAFFKCTALKSAVVPGTVKKLGTDNPPKPEYGVFQKCTSLETVVINEGVTSIGEYAFAGCNSLNVLIIPEGVTSIAEHAFYNCTGLSSVVIPEGMMSIGEFAFENCSSLTSMAIPESATDIGRGVFDSCISLTSVTIPKGVKSIKDWSFSRCSALKSVTLPEGVTSIGVSAFCDCASLISVNIPASVRIIEGLAFTDCTSLTDVTIPEGVTSIGGAAFSNCTALKTVTIPGSVRHLGDKKLNFGHEGVFEHCVSLETVIIKNGVEGIGFRAFCNCSNLKKVTLPKFMISIGYGAFSLCTSLTSVTIPIGVSSIDRYAFDKCKNLSSVYCESLSVPYGADCMFSENAAGRKIYVPLESVEDYKRADKWCAYAADIVGYDFSKK